MTELDLIIWLECPVAKESFWMLIVKNEDNNHRPVYFNPGTSLNSFGSGIIVELFDLERYRRFKAEGGSFHGGEKTWLGDPAPSET